MGRAPLCDSDVDSLAPIKLGCLVKTADFSFSYPHRDRTIDYVFFFFGVD